MKQRIISFLLLVSVLLTLAGCDEAASVDTKATESSKTITTAAAEDITTSASEAKTKPVSNRFNTNTNETITFRNMTLQVPNTWVKYQDEDELISWLPEQDSDEEIAHVFLIRLGGAEYTEDKLKTSELQEMIANEVNTVLCADFENLEASVMEYSEDLTRPSFIYTVTGQYDSQDITIGSCSFVVGDELYLSVLRSSPEDSFNHSEDMVAVLKSIQDISLPIIPENSTFSIHFIDVGQADAALVECDGHYMLIDGGNKADSNVIYSVLKQAAVPKLDIVVGTHAHEDHIGGLPGAFNYAAADLTLCPVTSYDSDAFEDFAKYANQKGNGITVPKAGDTYNLGSATVKILGLNAGDDPNDTSIVLRIDYGETSFLFTGDAERAAEQTLLDAGADLSATVLKVGHHGSDSSTSYVFLRDIMPEYAVISVGEDNSYGHPTEDVLSRLRDADVKTFRTDLQGDIYCVSDGKEVSFTVEKNANADTLEPPKPEVVPPATEAPKPTEAPTEAPTETEAEEFEYIGNKNSKKFHETWCSSVDKMKESNKYYYTGTRQGIINKGYDPCKNCNP